MSHSIPHPKIKTKHSVIMFQEKSCVKNNHTSRRYSNGQMEKIT